MSVLFRDTHPKMEALQIQLWRESSPTRKMHMLAQLNAAAKLLAMAGLRAQFPQASEAEVSARFASPEDTILAKLEWYRAGGEVSDRQWRDILGVLLTRARELDRDYLRQWAVELAVADLLERAYEQTSQ